MDHRLLTVFRLKQAWRGHQDVRTPRPALRAAAALPQTPPPIPLPPTPACVRYDDPFASLPPGSAHPQTLSICISLCESGVNPEALASVVTELRREKAVVEGSRATAPV